MKARNLMATYTDMEELIRLGAYRKGTTPEVDRAIDAQIRNSKVFFPKVRKIINSRRKL